MKESIRKEIEFLKNENRESLKTIKKRTTRIVMLERKLEKLNTDNIIDEILDINIPKGIYGADKKKVVSHKQYKGKAYLYNVYGRLIISFENTKEAAKYCEKTYEQTFLHNYIGYACEGRHGWEGNHKYKGLIWFNKELSKEEIKQCKDIKLFREK